MSRDDAPGDKPKRSRWIVAGLVLVFVLLVASIVLAVKWPFSRQNITASIQEIVSGTVQIGKFRSNIFPHPGCEVEAVIVRRSSNDSDNPPLVTVERISIQAGYADLFLRPGYLDRIVLGGMRIHVPARGSGANNKIRFFRQGSNKRTNTRVGEIIADGSVLEIARQEDKQALTFEIHSLLLTSVSPDRPLSYKVALTNAIPPGEITSEGHVGPWNVNDIGQTPVSGSYRFRQANLGVFAGISGMLFSEDKFDGELKQINARGTIEIPNFKVKSSNHEVHLHSRYVAIVNATNGDVFLREVDTSFLQTMVIASGGIAAQPGKKGKITSINIGVHEGKIEDVLQLFVQDPRPPLAGQTSFQAMVRISPEGRPFLQKINLRGDFGVGGGHFTHPGTQASVDDLSKRARGDGHSERTPDYPENVISDLKGHVLLHDGLANFTNLSFNVPGASAHMNGTYNLLNQKISFHGTLKTEAKLSQTTSGLKSALLKPFDDLFKKKNAGADVPVEMTGTYTDPHFGLDLNPAHKHGK